LRRIVNSFERFCILDHDDNVCSRDNVHYLNQAVVHAEEGCKNIKIARHEHQKTQFLGLDGYSWLYRHVVTLNTMTRSDRKRNTAEAECSSAATEILTPSVLGFHKL
jgi:hypothetical protein